MKKYTVLCAVACAVLAFTGCKSTSASYRQAYDKAKQADEQSVLGSQSVQEEAAVVTPMVTKQANQTAVVDNGDNIRVREENVSLVSGSGLKAFSVVVGSFSVKPNADGLQQRLREAGYNAQVAVNNQVTPPMYRVIITTFDTKVDAENSRNELKAKYADAWLLYKKN